MAQIQDRKSNLYSQKQSVRDEDGAPKHLESAGDNLIKALAEKQTKTSTTLEEQLKIVQNFEKGFKLSPDYHKGISTFSDFKKWESKGESSQIFQKSKETEDVDSLMKKTGLTRHELELVLCEKPNSTISQLYKFAIGNKKQDKSQKLENQIPNHPINRLKEIEEECFGHLKRKNREAESVQTRSPELKKKKTSKKRRKRRKKTSKQDEPKSSNLKDTNEREPLSSKSGSDSEENTTEKPSSVRPSLWDVKDMKKWSESKEIGCKPRTFYTIKDGKIVKLETESVSGDVT